MAAINSVQFVFFFAYISENFPTRIRGLANALILFSAKMFGAFYPFFKNWSLGRDLHIMCGCCLLTLISLPLTFFGKETLVLKSELDEVTELRAGIGLGPHGEIVSNVSALSMDSDSVDRPPNRSPDQKIKQIDVESEATKESKLTKSSFVGASEDEEDEEEKEEEGDVSSGNNEDDFAKSVELRDVEVVVPPSAKDDTSFKGFDKSDLNYETGQDVGTSVEVTEVDYGNDFDLEYTEPNTDRLGAQEPPLGGSEKKKRIGK